MARVAEGEVVSLRSDASMYESLRVLGLEVINSTTFGRNDCFTESILQSLMHQGVISALSWEERDDVCKRCRENLVALGLTARDLNEFLIVHRHFHPVCELLRRDARVSWQAEYIPHEVSLALVVRHRGDRASLGDGELPENDVERSLGREYGEGAREVVLQLYCDSDDVHLEGYHFRWIRPLQEADRVEEMQGMTSTGGRGSAGSTSEHSSQGSSDGEESDMHSDGSAALSDITGDSDVSDVFHVAVEDGKNWTSVVERVWDAVQEFKGQLRHNPTMPTEPADAQSTRHTAMDGILWPLVHCAIRGCSWTGVGDADLAGHLCQQHRAALPQTVFPADGELDENLEEDVLAFYCEAVAEK